MKHAVRIILPFAFLIVCAVVTCSFAETDTATPECRPPIVLAGVVLPHADIKEQVKPDEMGDVTEEQAEAIKEEPINDPLEPFNRAMFHFNDKLYFWLLKPFSQGYGFVVPKPARSAVSRMYDNVKAPIRILNNLLQGKFHNATVELARFVTNSTAGVAGMFEVASKIDDLPPHKEDLGQTFGVWGMGHGFYLVLPFLGPSSGRDALGWVGDRIVHPLTWVEPWELSLGFTVHETVNYFSLHIGDYEVLKKAAVDPYLALRNGFVQYRKKAVEE